MGLPEGVERHGLDRNQVEFGASQITDDGLPGEVGPQALGLAVVHDQRGVEQAARGAEVQDVGAEPPVVGHRRVAQRTVRDGDGDPADDIVDQLVPDHDPQRVGPGLAARLQRQHRLGAGQPVHLGGGLEPGVVDGGDAVGRGAARADLRRVHQRLGEVGVPRVVERAGNVLGQRVGHGRRGSALVLRFGGGRDLGRLPRLGRFRRGGQRVGWARPHCGRAVAARGRQPADSGDSDRSQRGPGAQAASPGPRQCDHARPVQPVRSPPQPVAVRRGPAPEPSRAPQWSGPRGLGSSRRGGLRWGRR